MEWSRWLAGLLLLSGCIDPEEPGTLVPPTVAEDPRLPAHSVQVAGKTRRVHVREYGDASLPPLVVLPGSASDMRAYLPLRALSDEHRVIFWDLRGNGLSERVDAAELSFDAMAEEIAAIREIYAPGGRISLLAHSWSAAFVALYLARHPEDVQHVVLLEPPGLKAEFQQQAGLALNLLAPGYLDLVWTSTLLPPVDHATLDYEVLGMLHSGVRDLFCDADHPPPWPVWRPGGLALVVWESAILDGTRLSYDFTPGLERLQRRVLLVGSECSPIGTEFQRRTNLTALPGARLAHLAGSGHRMLTERPDELIALIRSYLQETP